ncbi:MAG TPA: hypothetical protein VHO01_13275 [Jatrophihabitans sp.]|nr:hypothetical protein [Jatrophihabitans sp.]
MTDRKLTKSTGEHWVCTVLSGLGWAVALTRDGIERTDVLAASADSSIMISVQVKASRSHQKPNWVLGAKSLLPARTDREWYVLVTLPPTAWEAPVSFVVPRDHIAAGFWIAYRNWLTEPGVPAGKRNTSVAAAHTFEPVFRGYRDRWDLLEAPTSAAPVLLPPDYRPLALDPRVGLPAGHPWQGTLPAW